jgi:hypothetical protein
VQLRITANLYGRIGQSWGLVNGEICSLVDVIFDEGVTEAQIERGEALPTLVARMESYMGPAFCAADPKLFLIPPIERRGSDCSCPCTRRMLPVRVAEGTTIHSLQGITVGADKPDCKPNQVKRLGIDFGKKKVEQSMPGLSMVAQSRPQSKTDFCFTTPVDLERLAVCGSGESARPLKEANAAFEAQAKQSDVCQFERADFEALLDWAVDYAQRVHRIRAPWLPVADADDEPMDEGEAGPSGVPRGGDSDEDAGAGDTDVDMLMCMEADDDDAD